MISKEDAKEFKVLDRITDRQSMSEAVGPEEVQKELEAIVHFTHREFTPEAVEPEVEKRFGERGFYLLEPPPPPNAASVIAR